MNSATRDLLLGLYGEWRRLSDLEAASIRKGDWEEVDHHQTAKQALRDQIVRAIQVWNAEHAVADTARARFEREFRPVVAELIQQETRNQGLLQEQRCEIESRLASARCSSSRLRGLHRSYGSDVSGHSSRWQSYS